MCFQPVLIALPRAFRRLWRCLRRRAHRSRKLRRVDTGRPRDTRRQTWHVDVQWIEQVKEMAEAGGVPQAEIVDRAFRQFFG